MSDPTLSITRGLKMEVSIAHADETINIEYSHSCDSFERVSDLRINSVESVQQSCEILFRDMPTKDCVKLLKALEGGIHVLVSKIENSLEDEGEKIE